MVEVDWQSVRLLDCPVVQRLRSIHQLGFSYLTYPSAEHSRFVHSLGMYAVVSRFLDAMERSVERNELDVLEGVRPHDVEPWLRADLLHAAILHDVGHFPFSHATEFALKNSPEEFICSSLSIEEFLFTVQEELQEDLPLAEALSLAIILSKRFENFYRNYVRPGEEGDEALFRVAALVAGLWPTPNHRGAAQLISDSAIDSDKVDYINRDALACGIPIGIDVARLFLRSAFYEVGPERIKQLIPSAEPTHDEVIFIVNSSGVDTIDELANAKLSLYQRVYLHQTTRNAERLLSRCLESLPAANSAEGKLRDAIELLGEDDASLLKALEGNATADVGNLAKRLRNRQLPKRACVFGRTLAVLLMPIDQMIPKTSLMEATKHTIGMVVERLRHRDLIGKELRELERAISTEAAQLKGRIQGTISELLPSSDEPALVTVLAMTEIEGPRREAVVLENNELIHSSHRTISDEQGDAADIYKALGYVVCDPEWREIVCLAARKVFASKYREPARPMLLRRGPEATPGGLEVQSAGRLLLDLRTIVRRTGLPPKRIAELQRAAEKVGWFDDMPWLLAADEKEFVQLAAKLKKFDGEQGWTVTAATCATFVSQFPPRFRKELRSVLHDHLHIIDREVISGTLTSIVRSVRSKATKGKVWVTGLSPDSGSVVRMLLEQESRSVLEKEDIHFAKSIHECLAKAGKEDEVVLCDDNISSGVQLLCQFRSWFGITRDKWPEEHRRASGIDEVDLGSERLEKLKELAVTVAICEGSQSANDRIGGELQKLGMKTFRGIVVGHTPPSAIPRISSDLYEFMKEVGADLVAYYRYGSEKGYRSLDDEKQADCLKDGAGYENGRGLRCTYLNVPTSTFTSLWAPGWHKGDPWMPLLLRRGYLSRLVVA